jgi:hypothetical protein
MCRYFPEILESKTEFLTQLRQNSTVRVGHPKALVTINNYSGTFREIFKGFKQINIRIIGKYFQTASRAGSGPRAIVYISLAVRLTAG